MIPDNELLENGILIVTGSSLRAEQADRPLAYKLKATIEDMFRQKDMDIKVLVLSDLWYLNGEALQQMPIISIGGTEVNAVSSFLFRELPNALVVDDTLMIQMDVHLEDLRVSVWGANHQSTVDALDIFVKRGYLKQFLDTITSRKL